MNFICLSDNLLLITIYKDIYWMEFIVNGWFLYKWIFNVAPGCSEIWTHNGIKLKKAMWVCVLDDNFLAFKPTTPKGMLNLRSNY